MPPPSQRQPDCHLVPWMALSMRSPDVMHQITHTIRGCRGAADKYAACSGVHAERMCFPFQGVLPRSEQIVMRCESLGSLGRAIWEVSVYSWFLGQPKSVKLFRQANQHWIFDRQTQ